MGWMRRRSRRVLLGIGLAVLVALGLHYHSFWHFGGPSGPGAPVPASVPAAGKPIREINVDPIPEAPALQVEGRAKVLVQLQIRIVDSKTGFPISDALLVISSGESQGRSEESASVLQMAEATLEDPEALPASASAFRSVEDGRVESARVEPGDYSLAAVHEDYLPASRQVQVSGGESRVGVELQLLSRWARLSGWIRAFGGPPGPTSIHALGADSAMVNVQVGPGGAFEMAGIPPGTRTVILQSTDPFGDPIELVRSMDFGAGDDLEIEFPDLGEIPALLGAVRGAAGPGDSVFLYQDTGSSTVGRDAQVSSDGTFRFAAVERSDYLVIVGPAIRPVEVSGSEDVLIEVFVPHLTLRGQVLDSSRRPVKDARIMAFHSQAQHQQFILDRSSPSTESDAEGLFILEPLDHAVYAIEVEAQGSLSGTLAVQAGEVEFVTVMLQHEP